MTVGMTVHSAIAGTEIAIIPTPSAYFGIGAVGKLPAILSGAGSDAAVVVTDAALAATPVVASVTGVLEAAGIPAAVFSGVHPNPTTGDPAG
jgi:alcohol dehydrogenase class IV